MEDAVRADRHLFLLFSLGTERYALEAGDIAEILPLRRFKQVPATPSWVAGLFTHRGAPVPVIDLSALAVGTPSAARASTRLVLVHYRHRTRQSTHLLGLVLEHAVETQYLRADAFASDGLTHAEARYLGPVADTPGGVVQWVRAADLLPDDVHDRLFPEPEPMGAR
jgi:chemotaxis-related protein WspB